MVVSGGGREGGRISAQGVYVQGQGGVCPGEWCVSRGGGVSAQGTDGVSAQGVSAQGCLTGGGGLPRGMSAQGAGVSARPPLWTE